MNQTSDNKDQSVRRKKLTPYQKILRASKRGTGLRLTFDEVFSLSSDTAIETRASLDNEGEP